MHNMQQPTLNNCVLRSTRDADLIFYTVAQQKLPLITRRLDAAERSRIVAGNAYVWEEKSTMEASGLGMERWTDSIAWGPSRVRDEFLYYHQKDSTVQEEEPWARITSHPTSRSHGSDRLIKQTYSVHVSLPSDKTRGPPRKWHLTAYYNKNSLDDLRAIQDIPDIGSALVPEGWFKSARALKVRRDRSGSSAGKRTSSSPSSSASFSIPSLPSQSHRTFPTGHCKQHRPSNDFHFGPPSYPASSPPPIVRALSRPSHSRSNSSRFVERPPSSPSPVPSDDSSSSMGTDAEVAHGGYRCNKALIAGKRTERLVPLNYLQSISFPRREPMDEQFLRLFSTQAGFPSVS